MQRCILVLILLVSLALPVSSQNLDSLYNAGTTAYDSGKFQTAISVFEEFEQVRKNYPPVVMYLAMLYSFDGQLEKAYAYLNKTALMNADTTFLKRAEFDPIRQSKEFKSVNQRFLTMLDTVRHSERAFSLSNNQIHPEALAYDAERSRFFIGSIRLRSIFIYESGRSYAFKTEAEDSLLAVTGLSIDREEGLLWVTSANMPQMKLQEGAAKGSFVHVYDIISGDLLRRFRLSEDVMIGDVIVGKNGLAYMTNSMTPEIYRASIDSVSLWRSFPELKNLQGIAESPGGELFISDYIHGIYRLKADSLTRITCPDSISVKGIDGLYYKKDNLIGIQNGVYPMRVTQYTLNEAHDTITGTFFLDKNLADMNEPVQGVWVGDWFYFIANSPWGYYDQAFELSEQTPEPEVWRTNLVR